MFITCPTCASSYRIKAAKIGPEGRSVRCAACRETWFLTPSDAIAEQDEPTESIAGEFGGDAVAEAAWAEAASSVRQASAAEETPTGEEGPAQERTRKRAKAKAAKPNRRLPWHSLPLSPMAIVGLAVLATLPVAALARTQVVGLMPRTAPLFSALGLPVNRRGLEIRDLIAFQNAAEDDKPAELVVEGDVVGVGRGDVAMPPVSVAITDAAGKLVRTFTAPAPRARLGAGETTRFRARLSDPPVQGRVVTLRFADATTPVTAQAAHD